MQYNIAYEVPFDSGETVQFAHEPDSTLVMYFLQGDSLVNKSAMILLGDYGNVTFADEPQRFTRNIVKKFGVKSIIGKGAYGYYQSSKKTFVKTPINVQSGKEPPQNVIIGETDTTITYSLQNPDVISYEWFRFVFAGEWTFEFKTSSLTGKFEKPFGMAGNFELTVIGYRNETLDYSRPTEPVTVNITLRSD
jgi:hypothetical protein